MKISVRVEYFESFDQWSWEVTINGDSVWGVEVGYDSAFAAAESVLEDMTNERREA